MPQQQEFRLRKLAAILVILLAACQPVGMAPADTSAPDAAPAKAPGTTGAPLRDDPAITCAAQGGKMELVGLLGTPTCIRPAGDAGKFCEKAGDCSSGTCLAEASDGRPRCAPTTPYFGCHSVMDATGTKAIICTE